MTTHRTLGRFVAASAITMLALVAIVGAAHLLAPMLDATVEFTAAALLAGAFSSQTVQRILSGWDGR